MITSNGPVPVARQDENGLRPDPVTRKQPRELITDDSRLDELIDSARQRGCNGPVPVGLTSANASKRSGVSGWLSKLVTGGSDCGTGCPEPYPPSKAGMSVSSSSIPSSSFP